MFGTFMLLQPFARQEDSMRMSASSVAAPIRQRIAWGKPVEVALSAKACDVVARMHERLGAACDSAWTCSSQAEHLLAYATWGDTLFDPEDGLPAPHESGNDGRNQ